MWLIDKHFARDFRPFEPLVEADPLIDAEEQGEIHLPLIPEEGRRMAQQLARVAAPLGRWHGDDSADSADKRPPAIRVCLVLEHAGMAHRHLRL
jgi:hypothetical protein